MNSFSATSNTYDNTKLSAYKVCPRSYFIRHVLGWRSDGTANPLVFGLGWHNAMDAVWEHATKLPQSSLVELGYANFCATWEENGFRVNLSLEEMEDFSPRTPGIAKEMLHGYVTKNARMLQEATLIAGEKPFAVPIPSIEDTWYVGRLDKVIEYNTQILVLEHKTTTAYALKGNFRDDYVNSWYSSSQVKGYEFAASLYYPGLDGVWVDAALVHKKIHDAFKFIPVNHNVTLLLEWLEDMKQWVTRIQVEEAKFEVEGELKPGMFPRNEESCFGKYGHCPFLDICRTVSDPSKLNGAPPGYVHEVWSPFDTLGLDKLIQEKKE